MKKIVSFMTTRLVIIILLSTTPVIVAASPGGLEDDPGVPLDGGVGLVIAATVAYGIKKSQGHKKQN